MKRYRLCRVFLALLSVVSLCVAQTSSGEEVNLSKVVGTWKLLSVETLRPGGEVLYEWMGRNPVGLIIYDPTGHMLVQIMRDPRPTFASGQHWTATPEEIKGAYEGYYAYFGTYEVNEKEGTVIHHVQASLWPREVGIDYKRQAGLSGDRLVLTTPPYQWAGEQRTNRLTWERVK